MIEIKKFLGENGVFWNEVFFDIASNYSYLHDIGLSYSYLGYICINCDKKTESLCRCLIESMG